MENASVCQDLLGCTQLKAVGSTHSQPGLRRPRMPAGRQLPRWSARQQNPGLSLQMVPCISTQRLHVWGQGAEQASPSPVQLQGVTLALMSDLIFWQATVAVQFYVVLVPGHLWLRVSWEGRGLGYSKVSSKTERRVLGFPRAPKKTTGPPFPGPWVAWLISRN
jgi:hypothetical protein